MGVLLCKPTEGVWAITGAERQPEALPCPFPWPCVPCTGPGCVAFACQQTRECLCVTKNGLQVISRMPCVPGICEMCFSICGRYLYQLSSEADCIHTSCVATGELLFAAPVGVFPRCMKQDREGKLLLCAGGAANEAVLLHAPELTCERVVSTRHPCFAADFWRDGLLLVCAVEGEDIRTVLYTLAPGKVRPRKLLELPGPPGSLCVCPDGKSALISTRGGLARVDLTTGALLWNCPEWALGLRLECAGETGLISDTLDGSVCLFHLQRPWERKRIACFAESQACFL